MGWSVCLDLDGPTEFPVMLLSKGPQRATSPDAKGGLMRRQGRERGRSEAHSSCRSVGQPVTRRGILEIFLSKTSCAAGGEQSHEGRLSHLFSVCFGWGWADKIAGGGRAQTAGAEAVAAVRKNQTRPGTGILWMALLCNSLWGRDEDPRGGGAALLEGTL